jgi:hypothetical protein
MSELEKTKYILLENIQRLCAHCVNGGFPHTCPVQKISQEIQEIRGVPLIVNDEFRGMIFR